MRTKLAALASLLAIVFVTPNAAAHPVDVYNFPILGAPFPFGVPPGPPPSITVGPFVITRVTADTSTGAVNGAGSCVGNIGQACILLPLFNPATGAPTGMFDCEIVGAAGPWMTFGLLPELYMAQDLDGNGILQPGPDAFLGPIGFAYGSPVGPIPVFPPAGAYGGAGLMPGGPGPFFNGLDIHFIAGHSGAPLGPWSALLSMTVICWVV